MHRTTTPTYADVMLTRIIVGLLACWLALLWIANQLPELRLLWQILILVMMAVTALAFAVGLHAAVNRSTR